MPIPPEYQILLGAVVAALGLGLFRWINDYRKNKDEESQQIAFLSIFMGILIMVPFLAVIGLLLAIISLVIKKNKRLSKVALLVNLLGLLPWLAVLFFGA